MVRTLVTFAKVKCSENDEEWWAFLSWRCRNGPQSLMAKLILCTWSWKLKLLVTHYQECLGNPLRLSRLNQWFVGHEGEECNETIQTHWEICMSISWLDCSIWMTSMPWFFLSVGFQDGVPDKITSHDRVGTFGPSSCIQWLLLIGRTRCHRKRRGIVIMTSWMCHFARLVMKGSLLHYVWRICFFN